MKFTGIILEDISVSTKGTVDNDNARFVRATVLVVSVENAAMNGMIGSKMPANYTTGLNKKTGEVVSHMGQDATFTIVPGKGYWAEINTNEDRATTSNNGTAEDELSEEAKAQAARDAKKNAKVGA